jgi:hypothetical protein
VDYADAVFCVKYRVERVVAGTLDPQFREIHVYHWLFRNRTFLPTADVKPGRLYRLKLIPWENAGEAAKERQLDDFFALQCFFSEIAEPVDQ